jgi:hypothetical protein
MLSTSAPPMPLDEAGRQRMLAKIYALLILVAEETEEQQGPSQAVEVAEQHDASEAASEADPPNNSSEPVQEPHLDN